MCENIFFFFYLRNAFAIAWKTMLIKRANNANEVVRNAQWQKMKMVLWVGTVLLQKKTPKINEFIKRTAWFKTLNLQILLAWHFFQR